ncbi:MAG TPA: hypothetical protein VMO47_07035 [Rhodothermales bacterium]|nr:hypothetical protein [Rhodothermales bacterium]
MALLPPYAGLDELYHVARISFVAEEGRQPVPDELSVPLYLQRSLALEPGSMVSFAQAAVDWPNLPNKTLQSRGVLTRMERETYVLPNYEAQQPSPYYVIAASTVRVLPARNDLLELRLLRLQSVLLAVASIGIIGIVGFRLFGVAGIVAALALTALPTWHTFLIRASNDALAYFCLAIAVGISILRPQRWYVFVLEGAAWALALATKLYTWPVAIILPLLWWWQRPARSRIIIVALACAVGVGVTLWELEQRTGTSLGLAVFHEAPADGETVRIDYLEMVKITIASAIWMSGQHNNALTTPGMALYVLPPLILAILVLIRRPEDQQMRLLFFVCIAAVVAFAGGQVVHAFAHVKEAKAAGISLPLAGKEGWYWYVLTPLIVPVAVGFVLQELRRAVGIFFVAWLGAWDLLITEGALLRDFAGLTTPNTPSLLFRWGPAPRFDLSSFERIAAIAAGPLSDTVLLWRLFYVGIVAALLLWFARSKADRDGSQSEPSASR